MVNDPSATSFTTQAIRDSDLNRCTYGQGTSFPSSWSTSRLFWRTDQNILYKNIGTLGSPIWEIVTGGYATQSTFIDEDFICAQALPAEDGEPGAYGWSFATTGGTDANPFGGGSPAIAHPGILEVATINSTNATIYTSPSGTYINLIANMIKEIVLIVKIPVLTNKRVWFGIADSLVTSTPTDGIIIFYDSGVSANWQTKTRTGGAETTAISSTAVDIGWHVLRIIRTQSGSIQFWVDTTLLATNSTNVPTTGNVKFGVGMQTLANTRNTFLIDFARYCIGGLTR